VPAEGKGDKWVAGAACARRAQDGRPPRAAGVRSTGDVLTRRESMTGTWGRCRAMLATCAVLLLQGGNCTKDLTASIDKVNATLSEAVQTLGDQSQAWQTTLTNLESKLAADTGSLEKQVADDVRGLITQIDTIVKDGGQFLQETTNCQIDIMRSHATIALRNLLSAFLNKHKYQGIDNRPMLPYVPIVCSANPNGVDVSKWDSGTFLVLSGTDFNVFNTQKPSVVVRKRSGQELVVADMGNRVTNYRYTVNVPAMIAQGLLKEAIQLQVRWNGQRVNQNEIPVVPCGGYGQPCCRGHLCDAGSCANDVCGACGQLNQPCCNGQICQAGNCVSGLCTACGASGQPCCSGNACNSGNKCLVNVCRPNLPACVWTAEFSEEGSAQQHCPSGFAMRGASCSGSNCDNIALYCCPYSASPDPGATKSWSAYFSEEHGGQLYPPSAATRFLSGLRCRGNYCDDVSMEYLTSSRLRFQDQCYQSPWFSEEGAAQQKCPEGQWVAGMACRGNNCDDLSLFCCHGEPVY
jgi:hypothetical protein